MMMMMEQEVLTKRKLMMMMRIMEQVLLLLLTQREVMMMTKGELMTLLAVAVVCRKTHHLMCYNKGHRLQLSMIDQIHSLPVSPRYIPCTADCGSRCY